MGPREVFDRRDEFTFLDVREWYEWEAGTVKDAIHVPIRQLSGRVDELARDRPVVVVCQVGQRSALAANFLTNLGFDAHNLEGGLEAWLAEGLPLVDGVGNGGDVVDGWAQEPEL